MRYINRHYLSIYTTVAVAVYLHDNHNIIDIKETISNKTQTV